jgi:hypothetical protein
MTAHLPKQARKGIDGEYTTALRIQRVISQTILEGNEGQQPVKPADLAALARAWDILAERKRILKGRPLPGSLKPTTPRKGPQTLDVSPVEE